MAGVVHLERRGLRAPLVLLVLLVLLAPRAPRVRLARLDPLALQDLKASVVRRVMLVPQAPPDPLALLAPSPTLPCLLVASLAPLPLL